MRSAVVAALLLVATAGQAADEITVMLPGDVPLVLVRIPAGTFMMGSPTSERGRSSERERLHEVTLTQDYYLGKYEITMEQWVAVVGLAAKTESVDQWQDQAAGSMSWLDVGGTGGFIDRLNQWISTSGQSGAGLYRLPTEAEWERAARAGSQTRFSFGDGLECDDGCGMCDLFDDHMWWCGNAISPGEVGQKPPNAFGLYDMHGNVWEWVNDWMIPGQDYPSEPQVDPTGPESGPSKLRRGGSYYDRASSARAAYRGYCPPDRVYARFGVRVARSIGDEPVADFSWGPLSPLCGQPVLFADGSTGNPTSWSWDFGDGASSSERNPVHAYVRPGTFTVTLTASNDDGTSVSSHELIVDGGSPPAPEAAGEETWIVPGAAHLAGAEETYWVTDIVLHNPLDAPRLLNLYFLEAGSDNSQATGFQYSIEAGWAVKVCDVVEAVFGLSETFGALLIGSEGELRLTSRTYNDQPAGTFGQYIPAMALSEALGAADTALLIQLESSDRFRTNIGLANAGEQPLEVTIDLYDDAGIHLGTRAQSLQPFDTVQVNRVFELVTDDEVGDGYAELSTAENQGAYLAYASVVDNTSGDPIFVAPVRASSEPQLIPAAAHLPGAQGTSWRTDVELHNPGDEQVEVVLELLEEDSDNSDPEESSYQLPARASMRLTDVLLSELEFEGSGALRVTVSGGAVAVTSRTYNDLGDRSYGQYIPALPLTEAITDAEQARVTHLAHSVETGQGFRTNIGCVNSSPLLIDVEVELRDHRGQLVDTLTVELPPYAFHQLNDVFQDLAPGDVDSGYALVRTTTIGGSLFAYASVVDNRSGDPVYVPAR
jgi:formylglycine-generating enzyme required for sulfatase activity